MDAVLGTAMALNQASTGVSALFLDVAIKGLIVLACASALVLSLRRASAATRHLVWCTAVCGLLVLPAVALVAPKWTVPGLPALSLMPQSAELALAPPVAGVPGVERGPARAVVARPRTKAPQVLEGRIEAPLPEGHVNIAPSANSGSVRGANSAPTVPAASSTADVRAGSLEGAVGGFGGSLLLLCTWLAGVFVLLMWMLAGMLRAWLLVRSAVEVTHGPLIWLFDELSEELGVAGRVTLLQTRGSTMPMAWGMRSKILLPADADDWTDARLRAVLLHELAHVRRRDYTTQLLSRLAATLYWFNPLVWVANHRMRVERELACDDQVLFTGSKASEYASHLLDIARSANGRAFATFGGVAMARRSRLSDRLLAVLDDTRRRTTVTPRMGVAAWAGAACFLFPVAGAGLGTDVETNDQRVTERVKPVVAESTAPTPSEVAVKTSATSEVSTAPRPALPIPPDASTQSIVLARVTVSPSLMGLSTGSGQDRCDWYSPDANTSHWMSGEDDDYQVRITMDDCRLEVEITGDIVFNDAETDIVNISRRGYFEMEERESRSRRRIVIEPTSNGDLERRWFVDGDERQYDGDASAWLRDMIPLLFRRVGLQAEERTGRILDSQGVEGVLQEISQIPSDYVARRYYQVLLTDGDLDPSQLQSIVRQAGDELESDYELAQLLVEVAENHPVDESVMVVYVEAAGSLESDYEQRRVLDAILSRRDLSQDVAEAMLRLATELESDYELAELLIAILHRHPIDEALTREFFEAVHTLDSDYEHNRVLKVALHEGAPNLQVLDLSLESATHIDSDYERAELLLEVARLYPVDQDIPSSYLVAAQSLDSDYELCRVLKSLIDHQQLSERALAAVLDAALTLDSDYELANLLITVADEHSIEGELRTLFMRSADAISSDYERGRVLAALTPRGGQPS